MTKIIEGDLILKEDTTFDESIEVHGDIKSYYDLKVLGNIDARDINARDINAWDINARNINAGNIDARNIDVMDIICEKRIKKSTNSKTISRVFVQGRLELEKKEQMPND